MVKNVPFSRTANRFNTNEVFYGQSYKFDVPGPGYYKADVSRN